MNSWHERYVQFIFKYQKRIILFFSLIFILSLIFSIKLIQQLDPRLENLQYSNSKSVIEHVRAKKIIPINALNIVIIQAINKNVADEAADKMIHFVNNNSHPMIEGVLYDLTEISDFYQKFSGHNIDFSVYKILEKKIIDNKLIKNLFFSKEEQKNRIKYEVVKQLRKNQKGFFDQIFKLTNYKLSSIDGKTKVLLLMQNKYISNKEDALSVNEYMEKMIESAKNMPITINVSGYYKTYLIELFTVTNDFYITSLISLGMVVLFLLYFYKSVRIVSALSISLVTGILITFALAYFALDRLNTNSAFLCSVIIGNAINGGIVLASFFIKAMANEYDIKKSITKSLKLGMEPTFFAALSAVLVFGTLLISHFKGFREFSLIGLWGMFIAWLVNVSLLPTILSLNSFQESLDYFKDYKIPGQKYYNLFFDSVLKRHKILTVLIFILGISSAFYIWKKNYSFMENDISALRSKSYAKYSYNAVYPLLSKTIFGANIIPQISLVAKTPEDAIKISGIIGSEGSLTRMVPELKAYSLFDFYPTNELEKNELINKFQRIPNILDKREHYLITKEEENLIDYSLNKNYEPLSVYKTPSSFKKLFFDLESNSPRIVHIFFNISKMEKDVDLLIKFIHRLRDKLDQNNLTPEVLGGSSVLMAAVMEEIKYKNSFIVLFAFFLVAFIFALQARKAKLVNITLMIYFLSMTSFMALIPLLDIKLNFLSFIAVPMTFGLGIDYSSTIFHQLWFYKDKTTINQIAKDTAPLVFACSLTTVIGYSTLFLFASHSIMKSFGLLCFIGENVTLIFSWILIPCAILTFKKSPKN